MPAFRVVDPAALLKPVTPARTARQVDPELAKMVTRIKTIVDATVVYEVSLEAGEKAPAVRQKLLRAAKLADVQVAIKKSPKGFYIGMMTPARRSKAGRKPKAVAPAE